MKTAVILGAGFSRAAGLPAVNQLFDDGVLPPCRAGADTANMESVLLAYQAWRASSPNEPTESWLTVTYTAATEQPDDLAAVSLWDATVMFLLRRVTPIRNPKVDPYYHGVTDADSSEHHRSFWDHLLVNGLSCVVSLNYDILAERALHQLDSDGESQPIFYYGGFMYDQVVRQMINITAQDPKKKFRLRSLGTGVPLYKLHGSANWAWDYHSSPNLKVYDDVRAAYRSTARVGKPAIVPPIPETSLPEEFSQVWRAARLELRKAQRWVVCGYSLPAYDIAVRQLLVESLRSSSVDSIQILDPNSAALKLKWAAVAAEAGVSPMIHDLPGLPQAIAALGGSNARTR